MKTLLTIYIIISIVIGALIVIAIPFMGIRVFAVFPEWFYIVLFMGFLACGFANQYYADKEDKKDALVNKLQGVVYEPLTGTSEIETNVLTPVESENELARITQIYPFIVSHDDGTIVKEFEEDGKEKILLKLCQQTSQFDLVTGTKKIEFSRFAFISMQKEQFKTFNSLFPIIKGVDSCAC